jgi:hypothetical protein
MEVDKLIWARKGDPEVGCDNFKPGKLNHRGGWLMGDLHCDLKFCPPVGPSQAFWSLFVGGERAIVRGKQLLTNTPTPSSPLSFSSRHTVVPVSESQS